MRDFYHWRALRYQKTLWRSHVDSVSRFLKSWKTPSNIILIGPSAGYSLPLDWIARFDTITVVEPEWMARKLLMLKLAPLNTPVTYLPSRLAFEKPGFLDGLDVDLAASGVLFCNVLGQVKVGSVQQLQASLRETLAGVNWASFHDRFSSDQVAWKHPDGEVGAVIPTSALIPESSAKKFRKLPVVQEHLASDALAVLNPRRVSYWEWQITPKQVHLIEGMIAPGF